MIHLYLNKPSVVVVNKGNLERKGKMCAYIRSRGEVVKENYILRFFGVMSLFRDYLLLLFFVI